MKKFDVREILNKFKWHSKYSFSKVSIVYIDRPKGFSELKAEKIDKIGHKFIYLNDGTVIPLHRIVEIKYEGETFWRRKNEKRSCKR
jgi:hypothetical protein